MKFLCGVARGLLIVTPSWLDNCKSAGRFIGECTFILVASLLIQSFAFGTDLFAFLRNFFTNVSFSAHFSGGGDSALQAQNMS